MPQPADFPACGTIVEVRDGVLVFTPEGSNYRLHLAPATPYSGDCPARVQGLFRAVARKIWTVPSGGNFLVPIFGPPRIVQGRIRYLDERQMVVHAGTDVIVDLPDRDDAYDMVSGPLTVGALVNATLMAGARLEVV